jgi:predicted methyltransferase
VEEENEIKGMLVRLLHLVNLLGKWVNAQRIAWFQVTISKIVIHFNKMKNEMISCEKFNASDTIAMH